MLELSTKLTPIISSPPGWPLWRTT